jgi:hypothetical protein
MAAEARKIASPGRSALRQRAAQLTGQWAMARKRVMRRLAMIGLSELWNTDHPVRRAAA